MFAAGLPGTSVEQAEPDDVRQVWVVRRVPGSSSDVTLRSREGRFLGVSGDGKAIQASSEAVGPAEQWTLKPSEGEEGYRFRIYNASSNLYLGIEDASATVAKVSVYEADDSANCTFSVRIQARFRPARASAAATVVKEGQHGSKLPRKTLERMAGRALTAEEVHSLNHAAREGQLREAMLDVRVRGKSDKYA